MLMTGNEGTATATVQAEALIHPVYLPFTASQLRQHFAPVKGREDNDVDRHIEYYCKSAKRYRDFVNKFPSRSGSSLSFQKKACQIEKDERFWVAACWLSLFHSADRGPLVRIMTECFGETPPVEGISTWKQCLDGDLRMFFEAHLPSPAQYTEWLFRNSRERNLVPYVLSAAERKRGGTEGRTRTDVVLVNATNGFAIVIEAKVLSDVSYYVSFNLIRNQLARNIDVMLDANERLKPPLSMRDPNRTVFLLQTPKLFREHPHSRLYGWLFNDYRDKPQSLARDLPHRSQLDCVSLSG